MSALKMLLAAIALGMTFSLSACYESEGPLEQAGEAADEAVKDTKRALEDAAD